MSKDIRDVKQRLARFCNFLSAEGLTDQSGHASVRLAGSDIVLINAGLVPRSAVQAEHIVTIDLDGRLIDGNYEPPKETPIHTEIYRARTDVGSVAHIHPRYASLFAIAKRPLIPVCNHGTIFGSVIPVYSDPDHVVTRQQGQELAGCLEKGRAVLMRGHGATVVGETIEACFAGCVYLEENARKLFFASLLGEVMTYSDDELERVARSVWSVKSLRKVWDYFESKAESRSAS